MEGYEKVVAALTEQGLIVPSWGPGQRARCPSHDDTNPSLSVGKGDDGRALVYCHAGCPVRDVVADLGLELSDLFAGEGGRGNPTVQLYTYTDEDGTPLFRVHRTDPKGFWQERLEDGEWKAGLRETRRVLYHLPALLRGISQGETVYVVEGEKDVHRIEEEGRVATTVPGGAAKWREEYADFFRGADVVIIGDVDETNKNGYNPGAQHVSRVRLGIVSIARSVNVVWPKDGKDATEHLDAGFTMDEFVADQIDLSIFAPINWEEGEGDPPSWLLEPWIPVQARVLGFGAAGSLKSLWAMWLSARLSRDGKRVAYFSLEMPQRDTIKRLKRLDPDPDNFVCFTDNLRFTNPQHIDQMMIGFRGYDLIVIDSWSSAHQFGGSRMAPNDEVAALDNEVFRPIIDTTGATLFILDNVGHEVVTNTGHKVKQQHARGASAKGDKMEMTIWFDRPDGRNNYRTKISCEKMRLDYPMPHPVVVETPRDKIEFYYVDERGDLTPRPMWPDAEPLEVEPTGGLTPFEERRLARLRDTFDGLREE